MKITKLEIYALDLPYAGGVYRLSGGRTYTSFDATFVRIVTDTGLDGWGESTPFGPNYIAAHALGVRAGIAELAPSLMGQDPRDVERLWDRMEQGLMGHNHAKTAIDVALWDVTGKAYGVPCYTLLGGSTGLRMPTISSIPADDPEEMRANVARHRARGFRGHSLKIGAHDSEGGPSLDAARIEAGLADRQPGEFYLVDANGGMTPETVGRMMQVLKPGLDFVFEAPCATWTETLAVRKRHSIALVLDELAQTDADIIQAIALDAADGIGLKISKAGGLTPGRRHRDIARAAGYTMSVQDTVGSTISLATIAHLGQTVPEQNLRCILDTRSVVTLETAAFEAPVIDGGLMAPDKPGLGIAVNRDIFSEPLAIWEM